MISDMNVNISHALYYSSGSCNSGTAFVNQIKKQFKCVTVYDDNIESDKPHIKDMQIARDFLRGGGQTYRVHRVFLDDICPDLKSAGMGAFYTMVAYFEESSIISVSFHYEMKHINSDKVIALRQSGVNVEYNFGGQKMSCTSLAEMIKSKLGLAANLEVSYLCEVTKFGDCRNIESIESEYSNLLYGLLTGDEGYTFVPQDMVRDRLSTCWGSRNFVRIYASRQSFLFLNLLDTPNQIDYLKRQHQYGTDIYGGINPYFELRECPLTVNHGILFSVEFVMILRALINDILSFQTEYKKRKFLSYYKRISETRNYRRRIIQVLERVEQTQIAEIGELSAVLVTSQHIAPIVEQVKYLLELLEGDLSLIYSERNNALVTVLTVLGLLLAVWQVILAF